MSKERRAIVGRTQTSKRSFWNRTVVFYAICFLLLVCLLAAYFIFPHISYVIAAIIIFLVVVIIAVFFLLRSKTLEGIELIEGIKAAFPEKKRKYIVTTEPLSSVNREKKFYNSRGANNIFYVNSPLPNSEEFYGRIMESEILLDRIREGACSSIVGGPRSGKSWLAHYAMFKVRYELNENRIKAGYIDAAGPACKDIQGFTREAYRVLGLSYNRGEPNYNLAFLEKSITKMGPTPVLFIDNFEAFASNPAFDDRFFEALRAMTQVGLAMVVVSREPLIKLVSRSTKRSSFFNIFAQIKLRPFSYSEAEDFVRAKAIQAELTEEEQEEMLKYGRDRDGGWPPLRLQLVGSLLLERKNNTAHPDYTVSAGLKEFEKRVEKEYSALSAP